MIGDPNPTTGGLLPYNPNGILLVLYLTLRENFDNSYQDTT